jgi:hypothetical protein
VPDMFRPSAHDLGLELAGVFLKRSIDRLDRRLRETRW